MNRWIFLVLLCACQPVTNDDELARVKLRVAACERAAVRLRGDLEQFQTKETEARRAADEELHRLILDGYCQFLYHVERQLSVVPELNRGSWVGFDQCAVCGYGNTCNQHKETQ